MTKMQLEIDDRWGHLTSSGFQLSINHRDFYLESEEGAFTLCKMPEDALAVFLDISTSEMRNRVKSARLPGWIQGIVVLDHLVEGDTLELEVCKGSEVCLEHAVVAAVCAAFDNGRISAARSEYRVLVDGKKLMLTRAFDHHTDSWFVEVKEI